MAGGGGIMIERRLIEFHFDRLGFSLQGDILGPFTAMELSEHGDAEYGRKLAEMEFKLRIANCSFEDIGISQNELECIKIAGAYAAAAEIVRAMSDEPGNALNCPRVLLLQRELNFVGCTLGSLGITREKTIALLPEPGDLSCSVQLWERKRCERSINSL